MDVAKIKVVKDFTAFGVFVTPDLVINGKVKSSGRLPTLEEISAWIREEED